MTVDKTSFSRCNLHDQYIPKTYKKKHELFDPAWLPITILPTQFPSRTEESPHSTHYLVVGTSGNQRQETTLDAVQPAAADFW